MKMLRASGFEELSYSEYLERLESLHGPPDRCLIKNIPTTTLYGTSGRREWGIVANDFRRIKPYVFEEGVFRAEVECKFQNGSGSVDEKFPYVVEQFIRQVETMNLFVVYAGDWWDSPRGRNAICWVEQRAAVAQFQSGHVIRILSAEEFSDEIGKLCKTTKAAT